MKNRIKLGKKQEVENEKQEQKIETNRNKNRLVNK